METTLLKISTIIIVFFALYFLYHAYKGYKDYGKVLEDNEKDKKYSKDYRPTTRRTKLESEVFETENISKTLQAVTTEEDAIKRAKEILSRK